MKARLEKARLDLTSPSFLADPYPAYAALRAEAEAVPVDPGGMWAVTAFDRVVEVLKRPEAFSSEPSSTTESACSNAPSAAPT